MNYSVVGIFDSIGVQRAYLRLDCEMACHIPLRSDGPKDNHGAKAWGWCGNAANPTVMPSIDCPICGFHKTLINGEWR